MKRRLIIAGNHAQAMQYIRENKLKSEEYIIASSPERIRGLRGVQIVRTGTWWNNPVAYDPYLQFVEDEIRL